MCFQPWLFLKRGQDLKKRTKEKRKNPTLEQIWIDQPKGTAFNYGKHIVFD